MWDVRSCVQSQPSENTYDTSDRDPTAGVSMRFITRGDVASSRAFDRDPTATT